MVVLPQGVAFATIAGLPPQYGLYAAIVPAVVAAFFGSSWHLVTGPTTAISIAVYAGISPLAQPGTEEYIKLALTLTFLTGLYQLVLGLARLGVLVNFISHTVIIGFTAGAAVLIAVSQIKNFFGLDLERGLEVHEVVIELVRNIGEINPYVTAVAVITLLSSVILRRLLPKLAMIVALVVGSLVAIVINRVVGGDATDISTVGALDAALPPFSLPDFSFEALSSLAFPALIVTMLALTEAVSIARSVAVKSEQRIDGNQEFIGQGLANLAGSFFSSYAASGSFNRTGVNYAAGARTPLAAVYASIFLVLILLVVSPLAAYLPTAAMAGVLFIVAWGLIDRHHIRSILRTSRAETVVLVVTFVGTLLDLERGIFLGIITSLLVYLSRTSRPELVSMVPDADPDSYYFVPADGSPECPQLKILRMQGSIFFGAVAHVQGRLQEVDEREPDRKHVLIAATTMNFVDIAGAEMLSQEARRRRRNGGGLYFYRVQPSAMEVLSHPEYLDAIGEENLFPVKTRPIDSIYPTLDSEICRNCTARIFPQCHVALPDGEPRDEADSEAKAD
jgi:SulP family sulfate permease